MEPDGPPLRGNTATMSSRDRKILLNILSPSSEVPQKLTYPDIPVSTTIIDLKRRIQNDVGTRPSPERQRLIYRGRALVQDDRTLEDIFGHEAVCAHSSGPVRTRIDQNWQVEASDVHSLHLVLPPIPGTSSIPSMNAHVRHAIPTSIGPSPLRDAHHPQDVHLSLPPRPASTGQLPTGMGVLPGLNNAGIRPGLHHAPLPGQALVFNPGPLPPEMQEELNAHMAAMGQPLGGLVAPGAILPNFGTQQGHQHAGAWPPQPQFPQFPLVPQPNFQHILAQQQQARALAGMQGVGNMGINLGLNQEAAHATQQGQGSGGTNDLLNRPLGPGTSSTVVREGQGPNGSQWRLVINQSVTPLGPPNTMGSNAQNPAQQPGSHPTNTLGNLATTLPGIHPGQTTPPSLPTIGRQSPAPLAGRDDNPPDEAYALMDLRLSHLERSLSHGIAPTDTEIEQTRHQLVLWQSRQPAFNGALEVPFVTRMSNIMARAMQLRYGHGRVPNQFLHGNTTALPAALPTALPTAFPSPNPILTDTRTSGTAAGSTTASSTTTTTSTNTMVYLLSSPSGPHALLVSPMGTYSSSAPGVGMAQPVNNAYIHRSRHGSANQAVPTPTRPNEPEAPAGPGPQGDPQIQQPEQARNLIRILLPLGGHLWLLIRLFGFVYFFTSGAGWYRTMLLCICAFLVFIAQTGILRPLQQAIWDPLRRHVEALVPLAGNNINAGTNGGPAQPNGQGAAAPQPDPRQMADRLLQNQNGEGGFVRRNVRRFERATALFIASLVPGVGERHIAARDAAEVARQAVEREREEQARREEEARQQAEGPQEAMIEDNFANVDQGAIRQEDQAGQQPLVEI